MYACADPPVWSAVPGSVCSGPLRHALTAHDTTVGVDPDKKYIRGTTKCCILHQYITQFMNIRHLRQKREWNKISGDYDAFLFPFIFSDPLFFVSFLQSPFSVAKSWGLASAVSSPSSGSGRSPAAKHTCAFYCALLRLMGVLEQS